MRYKRFTPLTLLLCICAIFMGFHATALADSDANAPTVNAWVSGENLVIIAEDGESGVDSVIVNGKRINYLVDGAVALSLKDYAGTKKSIKVSALDFAGNESATEEIENPLFTAQTPTAPPATAKPARIAASRSNRSSVRTVSAPADTPIVAQAEAETPAPTPLSTIAPIDEPTQSSAMPTSDNPLTPDGAGVVLDNANSDEGKEFYTIDTPDGNVFYLVIDRQRGTQNVYFLNSVTENDLMALAEKGDDSVSAIPAETPAPTPEPTPTPEPEEESPEPEKKGGFASYILIILLVVGGAGAAYYFKILKPKQAAQALDDPYGENEDEYDFDDDATLYDDGDLTEDDELE